MKIEDAKWQPPPSAIGRKASASVLALRSLVVGDVKRIVHDDLSCYTRDSQHTTSSACSLTQEINRLRTKGWTLDYYHEESHVLVIKRGENV